MAVRAYLVLLHLVMTGCVVEGETDESIGRSSAASVGPDVVDPVVNDRQAFAVNQFDAGASAIYPDDLYAAGAYLHPIQRVVVAAVDANSYPTPTKRRLRLTSIDVNSSSGTWGTVIGSPVLVRTGSLSMHGVGATSFKDSAGNVDALFVHVEPTGVFVTEVQGDGGGASFSQVVSGISTATLSTTVTPAIVAGATPSSTKILLAFARTGATQDIRVGFLTKSGSTWTFTHTADLEPRAGSPTCTGSGMLYRITATYNPTRAEFIVGWVCSQDLRAYAQRVDRAIGLGLEPDPFMVHDLAPDGAVHTGPQIVFNRSTNRILYAVQHNAHILTQAAIPGTLTCTRNGSNCVDVHSASFFEQACQWAISVDYWSGLEFREGSGCANSVNCTLKAGVSREFQAGGTSSANWVTEPNNVWPARPSNELSRLHAYVRAPGSNGHPTVLLHVLARATQSTGTLRYTFADDLSSFPEY